jgi:superfamily II DNA or RNA helicase
VLINATAMKARSLIVQKVGRVLRKYKGKEYALIFDFFDANIPILEYHSKRRMVVYRSYKTKMELID